MAREKDTVATKTNKENEGRVVKADRAELEKRLA
jgi:hypothetical protein